MWSPLPQYLTKSTHRFRRPLKILFAFYLRHLGLHYTNYRFYIFSLDHQSLLHLLQVILHQFHLSTNIFLCLFWRLKGMVRLA